MIDLSNLKSVLYPGKPSTPSRQQAERRQEPEDMPIIGRSELNGDRVEEAIRVLYDEYSRKEEMPTVTGFVTAVKAKAVRMALSDALTEKAQAHAPVAEASSGSGPLDNIDGIDMDRILEVAGG